MRSWVVHGGTVVTLDPNQRVIEQGAVAFEDGLLSYVGPLEGCSYPDGARRLDTRGHLILPGLVNIHTHTPMTFMRSVAEDCESRAWFARVGRLEEMLTDDDLYWSSLLGCCEMLRNGITCTADRFSRMEVAVEAIQASGMRAIIGPSLYDIGRTSSLQEALRLVQAWGTSPETRISCGLAPVGADSSSTESLLAIRRAASETGAKIFIHVAQSRQELEAVRQRGLSSSVRYLHNLGFLGPDVVAAHCTYVTPEDIQLLAGEGVRVAHCPSSNAKIEGRVAPVQAMRQAGIPIALGTDCAACNNGMDLLAEARMAGLLNKVAIGDPTYLPAVELLQMITLQGAQVLDLQDQVGSLEVGKRADVIVLDGRGLHLQPWNDLHANLIYSARGSDVRHVFVDGELLVRDGNHTRLAPGELIERGEAWRRRVAQVHRGEASSFMDSVTPDRT